MNMPTVQDLPKLLEVLEKHPFGAIVLLIVGWLIVQGIKAWNDKRPPKP